MIKLVFLLEEPSMREALKGFLPGVLPDSVYPIYLTHSGKRDLEKSIPHKLKGWREPNVQFVVLMDQDSADCHDVKSRLIELCRDGGRPDTLVRVVCHELESWFLGDLRAVDAGMGTSHLACKQNKSKFRNPDKIASPAQEIKRLIRSYQKISGARAIGKHLDPTNNRSQSFMVFIEGLRRLIPDEFKSETDETESVLTCSNGQIIETFLKIENDE